MGITNKFKEMTLPGNYFITKSMELSKISDSGTLWYTKKFLVLYYYVFLSDIITTEEFQREIINIFDNYIDSLPSELKQTAEEYFYSNDLIINYKDEGFKTYNEFKKVIAYEDREKEISYDQLARKYYFAFLMNSGGQSGAKKEIKRYLFQSGYFDLDVIKNIIADYYDVELDSKKVTEQVNDYMAFLRNERQILYYYGYFHSKTSGSHDYEFSSLTPIGELALKANFYEFLVVWEHQKIKMVSQPVTIDMQKLANLSVDSSKFGINYSPYFTILKWINKMGEIEKDVYNTLISRTKENLLVLDDEYTTLIEHKNEIKTRIEGLGRSGDVNVEDFQKELKKYILGINDSQVLDQHLNPINVVKFSSGKLVINNRNKFDKLFMVYDKIDKYKRFTYKEILLDSENELKKQYALKVSNSEYEIDRRKKINWDLYAIHPDKFVIFGVIASMLSCDSEKEYVNTLGLLSEKYDRFSGLLKKLGYTKTSALKNYRFALKALQEENFSSIFAESEAEHEYVVVDYLRESSEDLFKKIKDESSKEMGLYTAERKRNTSLIRLLKAYYISLSESEIKCECCAEETFNTDKNGPYLEMHHLIPFSKLEGPDHYLNLYAICPNCHRRIHFIELAQKEKYYKDLDKNNILKITILNRLKELHKEKLLKSYQLEFLLAENAINSGGYDYVLE